MKYAIFLLALIIISCTTENEELASFDEFLSTVAGDSIKAHIAYLADDKLKGRLPGTPEYALAVDYVIKQYEKLGLEPAGENDTYLQEVIIRRGTIEQHSSSLTLEKDNREIPFITGEDYVFLGDLNAVSNSASAPLVFVGYGIDAKESGHCDYCEKDVTGKVVLVVSGAPDTFPAAELAHYSNYGTKFETAAKKGAIGMVLTSPEYNFQRLALRYKSNGNTGVVGPDGEAFGRRVFGPEMNFVAFMNWESLTQTMDQDLNEIWENYKNREIPNFPSDLRITAKTTTIYSEFSSPNVIGKIQGGDPALSKEYVVHTAHLDHVGIGRPVDGDSIYNGAHDNASGVASLLEIARLYKRLPEKPKRSILFIMVTAEEMGLLGSDYFSRFPTVDASHIVANVNTDMPTLIAPLLSIEPIGAEHSSIMRNVEEAATKLDIEIMPDHMPEQVRFVRSDQYNFIRRGIPALHVKYGLKSPDSLTDLSKKIEDYTANVYHKPSDELNDLFDFEAGEVYVKVNFLISYSIAQQAERPIWNQDSFFAKVRKR